MQFRINEKIFEDFPELHIGLIIAKGVNNNSQTPEAEALLREQSKSVESSLSLPELSEHPKIAAWRTAYSSFRAKPKKNRSSVENLCRMVLEGTPLRSISPVVDLYNAISLKHMMPVGGDDLEHVDDFIELTYASGEERFVPLNSSEEVHPKAGEVVYLDSKDVLCRRWNWRECDKSKMTNQSTNISLVVEGLPPALADETQAATEELAALVEQHCGAQTQVHLLCKDNPAVDV